MSGWNYEKNPNQFDQNRDLNLELSEYESSVYNVDGRCVLRVKNFITDALHNRRELE